MLDKNTKDSLSAIAFNDKSKPKDRVSACKLLLSLGIQTEAVCVLLHGFVDDADFPDGMKVKSIELLDKYEIKIEEKTVEDTSEAERKLMESYGL